MLFCCDATFQWCFLECKCVHRYTFKNNHGVTNITPLRGCSLYLREIPRLNRNDNSPIILTPFVMLSSPKLLFVSSTLFNVIPQPRRSNISWGIKAWPGNGSGVERGGGLSKRYHMRHATGVANSIARQFHPRGTHRVGLFSLDFLWFFLVSRQERTWKSLFAMFFLCDAKPHPCSLVYALRASQYKWE